MNKPIRWIDKPPTEAQMLAAGPFGAENTALVESLRARIAEMEPLSDQMEILKSQCREVQAENDALRTANRDWKRVSESVKNGQEAP